MDKTLDSLAARYYKWFDSISDAESYFFIDANLFSFSRAEYIRENNMDRLFFGFNIAGFKHTTLLDFTKEELYNTFRKLSETDLNIDWDDLDTITDSIRERIKTADPISDVPELFLLESINDYPILFWSLLNSTLTLDKLISFTPSIEKAFHIKEIYENIDEIGPIMEFAGCFSFMVNLLNYTYGSEYWDSISEKQLQSLKRRKKTPTFEELFREKDNAQKVKDTLEKNDYTIEGQWKGLTNDSSELLCAYYVLKPILKPGKVTPQAKIFYLEFGLPADFMTERMMRNEPNNANSTEFRRIFSHLIPKQ